MTVESANNQTPVDVERIRKDVNEGWTIVPDEGRRMLDEIERLRAENAALLMTDLTINKSEARAEKAERELAAWRSGNPSDDLWRVRMEQAERLIAQSWAALTETAPESYPGGDALLVECRKADDERDEARAALGSARDAVAEELNDGRTRGDMITNPVCGLCFQPVDLCAADNCRLSALRRALRGAR